MAWSSVSVLAAADAGVAPVVSRARIVKISKGRDRRRCAGRDMTVLCVGNVARKAKTVRMTVKRTRGAARRFIRRTNRGRR